MKEAGSPNNEEPLWSALGLDATSFTAVIEQMPCGFLLAESPSGRLILRNRQAEIVLGGDLDKHPSSHGALLARALRGETSRDWETPFRRAEGTDIWLNVNAAPVMQGGIVVAALATFHDITERKQRDSQQTGELQQRDSELQLIIDNVPAMVAYVDKDERYVRINSKYEEFFGLQREAIIGRTIADMLGEASYSRARPYIRRVLAGEACTYEARVPHRDGSTRALQASYTPQYSDDGSINAFVAMVQDVTDQKRIEAELRDSEAKFRALVEQSPMATQVVSLDGRLIRANAAWEQLWGVTVADIPDFNTFNDQQLRERGILPYLLRARNGETVLIPEMPFSPDRGLHKGEVIWVGTSAYPIKDENGSVREVVLVQEDLTARHRAEQALVESEQRFRILMQALPAIVWTASPAGARTYSNERWVEFTGQAPEASHGSGWFNAIHPQDQERLREVWGRCLAAGQSYEIQYRIRRHDGEWRWHLVRGFPLRNASGEIIQWLGASTDIHDQLEASERLAFALDASGMGDWSWDVATDVLVFSPRAAAIFGTSPDERVTWESLRASLHPEDRERTRAAVEQAVAERTTYDMEYRLTRPGREGRWVSARGRAIYSPDGSVTGMLGVVQDVTDRKRAEEERRYNAELTRTIAENASVTLVLMDAEGRATYINPAGEAMLGYRSEEIIGKVLHDLVHYQKPDGTPFPREECLLHGALPLGRKHESDDDLFIRKDGSRFPVRWYASPIVTNGQAVGTVAEIRDITQERRAAAEREDLLRREQKARQIAELLNRIGPVVAAELDPQRLTQKIVDLATRLTGASFGALLHQSNEGGDITFRPYALATGRPETFARLPRNVIQMLSETLRTRNVSRADEAHHEPGSTADPLAPARSYLAVPVTSRSGEDLGVMVFAHSQPGHFNQQHEEIVTGIAAQAAIALDNAKLFSDSQRAQNALRLSNEHLRRANEDLEQFAYSASHDLQEPLRMVSIYSEMLLRKHRDELTGQARDYLNFAISGAQRMERLVRDLLAYTRAATIDDGPVESVEASDALQEAISNLQTKVEETNTSVDFGDLPCLRVRKVHLVQLFQNLIGNAIKYRGDRNALIRVSAALEGAMWRICVADNGIGVEPEFAQHIFGIFRRLHTAEKYEGTGIGLAICQKIVERYGGRIWVESEGRDAGSQFLFTLPGEHVESGSGDAAPQHLSSRG